MPRIVRLEVRIDEHLVEYVEHKAAQLGVSVSVVVDSVLRADMYKAAKRLESAELKGQMEAKW